MFVLGLWDSSGRERNAIIRRTKTTGCHRTRPCQKSFHPPAWRSYLCIRHRVRKGKWLVWLIFRNIFEAKTNLYKRERNAIIRSTKTMGCHCTRPCQKSFHPLAWRSYLCIRYRVRKGKWLGWLSFRNILEAKKNIQHSYEIIV